MSLILIFTWLVITLAVTVGVLNTISKEYGEHVAESGATRVAAFFGVGTAVGLAIGITRWFLW